MRHLLVHTEAPLKSNGVKVGQFVTMVGKANNIAVTSDNQGSNRTIKNNNADKVDLRVHLTEPEAYV